METTKEKQGWEIRHRQMWSFNDIVIGHAISCYDRETRYQTSNQDDVVRLHFGLKGDYNFTYRQLGKKYSLIGGHHNIMYAHGADLTIENKSDEIETFGISFPRQLFIEFADDNDPLLSVFCEQVLDGRESILSENWGSVTSEIQHVIDEIIANPYTGSLENIFLLAKTLELLVLCIDNYKRANEIRPQYIKTQTDKKKIIAVRDMLNVQYQNPPNLREIAKNIGMNEFKLKHGFKEVFDSTIFGYITDKRLHHAKLMLQSTDQSIAEIAYYLGYSSPQHFSQQFKKKFAFTPNSVRKS